RAGDQDSGWDAAKSLELDVPIRNSVWSELALRTDIIFTRCPEERCFQGTSACTSTGQLNDKRIDSCLASKGWDGTKRSVPITGKQSPLSIIRNLSESLAVVTASIMIMCKAPHGV